MPKYFQQILTFSILFFHVAIAAHGFLTMFSGFTEWSIDHLRPFAQLLFSLAWAGICLKRRWSFFIYLTLCLYELAMKLFFGGYVYGQVFGDVFFPADLLFAFMILLTYKQQFHARNEA